MRQICSITQCRKPAASRGWCWTHYQRWRKWGDPLHTRITTCIVEGCDAPVLARGWCTKHYTRWQRCKNANHVEGRRDGYCLDCGRKMSSAKRRSRCKTCRNQRKQASGQCRNCRQPMTEQDTNKWECNTCRAKENERARARVRALKEAMLVRYGAACACCGESNPAFLTIDHAVKTAENRRKGPKETGHSFYRRIIAQGFPEGLQTLCFNCNIARQHNGGICPHQS